MATRRSLSIRLVIATAVAGVLATAVLPTTGQASPKLTLDQVKAQLASLQAQSEVAQENLNQAQVALAAGQRTLAQINANVARSQAAVSAAEVEVGRLASAAYRAGGLDQTLQLLTADNPTQFLEQASALDGVTRHQGDVLRSTAAAQQRLAQDKLASAQELAQLQALRNAAAHQYAELQSKQRQAQALYNQLDAAQRAELARERAAARARALARAHVSHSSYVQPHGGGGPYNGSIGGRVVAFALAQVGDSYVFGASGPNSWDCSGLTMKAYATVGISLPHSAAAQFGSGRHISTSSLEPGDLVFYYSPIHHVGIYIGGGRIVHAANPSVGVETAPLFSMPFDGAVRPY